MRPVTISIEGLRSFRRPVEIDFADRELFAIIGATGAGKSSILEAMTWALYGNATWTKQASALLGDGCPQMRVRLVFDADGNRWQVTRALKRRGDGTPGSASAELVCLDGERPAADGARAVNPAVEQLLGLDWDAFIRTVVLPQGQFARLLTESDVDRLRILAQIWRTDELVEARRHADEALRDLRGHLEYLRGRRQGYPADAAAEHETALARSRDAEVAATTLEGAVRTVERRERAAEEAQRVAAPVTAASVKLDAALREGDAQQAATLLATAADLDGRLERLQEQIEEQEAAVTALGEDPDDGGPDRDATTRAVATLERLAASLDDLAGHVVKIEDVRADAAKATADAQTLEQEIAAADRQVADAQAEVERWQRADAAAAAAHALHAGDDCPVCARRLPEGWAAPDASGLAAATSTLQEARDTAQRLLGQHREKVTEARSATRRADEEVQRLAGRLERIAAAVDALDEPFRPRLPRPFTVGGVRREDLTETLLADARAAADARTRGFEERDAQVRAGAEALQQLREQAVALQAQRHAQVTEPATRLRAQLRRIAECTAAIADAGVALPTPVPAVRDDLASLADDVATVVEVAESARKAAATALDAAAAAAEEEAAALQALLAEHDVDTPESLRERHLRARVDAQAARERAQQLERLVPVVAALDRHLDDAGTVAGALSDLKTLLQDGRFVRWLTVRRSRALLAVASTLLGEMTGGRYAFADITDEVDEWQIFDTDTGYARSPRTLSGGESFVASLALALGMVEMVARAGGRLEALFLDEGFGALDPDNLDAAIDALESSATRGRMVGVISHVPAVAERLTDVLAVRRAPTGSEAGWLSSAEREGLVTAEVAEAFGTDVSRRAG